MFNSSSHYECRIEIFISSWPLAKRTLFGTQANKTIELLLVDGKAHSISLYVIFSSIFCKNLVSRPEGRIYLVNSLNRSIFNVHTNTTTPPNVQRSDSPWWPQRSKRNRFFCLWRSEILWNKIQIFDFCLFRFARILLNRRHFRFFSIIRAPDISYLFACLTILEFYTVM